MSQLNLTHSHHIIGLALIGLALATPAHAQNRPLSLTMTCDAARAMVSQQGAVVMRTGPDLYDRYVRDRSFCTPSEQTIVNFIPTQDNKACFIGYTCQEITGEDEYH